MSAGKLASLDAAALGRDAQRRAEEHAARLAMAVGGGAEYHPVREGSDSDLALTAQALVRYAQTGDSEADWGDDASCAADALLTVHGALYRAAADDASGPLPRAWLADDEDPLALVARATLARVSLARDHGVSRAHLAALAGVSGQTIRGALAEGDLIDEPGDQLDGGGRAERPVAARSAREWLVRRGVPGAPRCECGATQGDRCEATLHPGETVIVRWVRPDLRGTATAARTKRGAWDTLRCTPACAEHVLAAQGEWAERA